MSGGESMGIPWRGGRRAALGLAAFLAVAACTGSGSASPAAPSSAATPAASTVTASAPPTTVTPPSVEPSAGAATPAAVGSVGHSPAPLVTPCPFPRTPPVATLGGLAQGTLEGRLGSYTWGSDGSDAPWIVGTVLATAARGRALEVALGGTNPASWTAAWAEVSGGQAGAPSVGASGSGRIEVTTPSRAGDWSLRVTATYGPAHNATYFWHLTITG